MGSGDHNICLHSNITGGWLSSEHIKLYLDINVGSAKRDLECVSSPFPSSSLRHRDALTSTLPGDSSPSTLDLRALAPPLTVPRSDLSHVTTLATKLRELNNKVADIQREQRYMREVEATFRDASESTNSRTVWWSLGQIAVLIAAGVWQMRHLKVRKFLSHSSYGGAHG